MKIFKIDGYFTDDKSEFSGYLVAEIDQTPEGYTDDQIFWYGLNEETIKSVIKTGEPVDDFIITSYTVEQE